MKCACFHKCDKTRIAQKDKAQLFLRYHTCRERRSVFRQGLGEKKKKGEREGGKSLPKYQQVVRSWKVVQPADFREVSPCGFLLRRNAARSVTSFVCYLTTAEKIVIIFILFYFILL